MWPGSGRTGLCPGSTTLHTLRHLYPDNPVLHDLAEETRLVVSEPLGDLAGAWNEVPESSREMAGSVPAGWGISPDGPSYPVRARF
jgi:hypothetical protein